MLVSTSLENIIYFFKYCKSVDKLLNLIFKVTIAKENFILWRKRALCYIHLCTLYVGFTVRIGAEAGMLELGLGLGLSNA